MTSSLVGGFTVQRPCAEFRAGRGPRLVADELTTACLLVGGELLEFIEIEQHRVVVVAFQ